MTDNLDGLRSTIRRTDGCDLTWIQTVLVLARLGGQTGRDGIGEVFALHTTAGDEASACTGAFDEVLGATSSTPRRTPTLSPLQQPPWGWVSWRVRGPRMAPRSAGLPVFTGTGHAGAAIRSICVTGGLTWGNVGTPPSRPATSPACDTRTLITLNWSRWGRSPSPTASRRSAATSCRRTVSSLTSPHRALPEKRQPRVFRKLWSSTFAITSRKGSQCGCARPRPTFRASRTARRSTCSSFECARSRPNARSCSRLRLLLTSIPTSFRRNSDGLAAA